jgi:hypothetical protein
MPPHARAGYRPGAALANIAVRQLSTLTPTLSLEGRGSSKLVKQSATGAGGIAYIWWMGT